MIVDKMFAFLLISFIMALIADGNIETISINTPSGQVIGYQEVVDNKIPINKFVKIPFAMPPVGNLRFAKPQPVQKWTEPQGVLEGFGPACMQSYIGYEGQYIQELSEDCLYMNIYTPGKVSPNRKLSVMVWIHGGGFVIGAAGEQQAQQLAAYGDVIVAIPNYRLGLFGFLNLHDPVARGNYGLWDQIMALRWVQENIASFGGNPESVTIFGESAGGMCVHFQTLIPSNKGLFHRAISMSGVANRQVITEKGDDVKVNRKLSENTTCPLDNPASFLECLRTRPADEIQNAVNIYDFMASDNYTLEMLMGPNIDGELIKDEVYHVMHDHTSPEATFFRSLDFMAGTTSAEGSLLYFTFLPEFEKHFKFSAQEGIPLHVLCKAVIAGLIQELYGNLPELSERVCEHYTSSGGNDAQSLRAIDFYGDIVMVTPTISALFAHSRNNLNRHTYHYVISAESPAPFGPPQPSWFKGCGHGDDLYLIFNMTMFTANAKMEQKHKDLSLKIIKYLSNFAKTGDPNTDDIDVKWPTYDIEERKYQDLNFEVTTKKNLRPEAMRLFQAEIGEFREDFRDEL